MAKKVHKIHSLPDDAPWDKGVPPAGSSEHPFAIRGIDRVHAIQRPLVLAHIRSSRLRNPEATPAQIVRMLEQRYLAAVTAGGATVGATGYEFGATVTRLLTNTEGIDALDRAYRSYAGIAETYEALVAKERYYLKDR